MAARNCLVALSEIKAVGFEFGTLLAPESIPDDCAGACEDGVSVLKALQKKGIRTSVVLEVPLNSKNSSLMQLEFSGLLAEECMFVGRLSADIKGANNAGMFTVLLDRSQDSPDFGQRFSISCLDELLHYL